MRRVLATAVVALIAGCSGSKPSGPAWPKSAGWVTPETWEEDGGESLEPRGDVAAVETSDEPAIDDTSVEMIVDPLLEELLGTEEPPPPVSDPAINYDYVPEETIIIEGELPPEP